SPAVARERLRDGVLRAMARAREGAFQAYCPAPPLRLEIDYVNAACADAAELVPGTQRTGGGTTAYDAPDAPSLLRVVRAGTILAGSTLVWRARASGTSGGGLFGPPCGARPRVTFRGCVAR